MFLLFILYLQLVVRQFCFRCFFKVSLMNFNIKTNIMKKQILLFGAILIANVGFSQNVFPTAVGTNVGIGTTTPTEKLEVVGKIKASFGEFTNSLPNGSVFVDYIDRNKKCNVLSAGTLRSTTENGRILSLFDFPQSNIDLKSALILGLEDRSDFNRFSFFAETGGKTILTLSNRLQQELFKVFEDGADNLYLQLGKPNSRVIIGGFSDYVPGLPHKLVVQNGSALIEGNILTNSNVGIGTVNFVDGANTYRLSVKGKIRAEEIKVYNTWADYVFANNYKLQPLTEVNEFIAKNGHLPNMPSASDVTKNGLELGDMAKMQQEKIEELTLYLINQNKEIETLKEQVKLLLNQKR